MTPFQKIIKYGAIAFAAYLCIVIIGGIVMAITAVFGITMGIESIQNSKSSEEVVTTKWSQEYSNVTNLEVDLDYCELEIVEGSVLKVEATDTADNRFVAELKENKLVIKDKNTNHKWYNVQNFVPKVTIYIPKDYKFEKIDLRTGASETKIDNLQCQKLDIEMGAGKYTINKIIAKEAKIETGAGEAIIKNSSFDTLKLEGGLGKIEVTSKILNYANIGCGVGKVDLNLIGTLQDYKIKTSTGLGNFVVNHHSVHDDETIGEGDVTVKVDAGVGETIVNFIEETI